MKQQYTKLHVSLYLHPKKQYREILNNLCVSMGETFMCIVLQLRLTQETAFRNPKSCDITTKASSQLYLQAS